MMEEVGQQDQIKPITPIHVKSISRQGPVSVRYASLFGVLARDLKDRLPVSCPDVGSRYCSRDSDAEHPMASGNVEDPARRG